MDYNEEPPDGNRVAGRDYYEHPVIQMVMPPPLDRPGLVSCPTCERKGLAPTAVVCPECGHDFTIARWDAYRRLMRKRGLANLTFLVAAITAINICTAASSPLGDVHYGIALTLWVLIGVLWATFWLRPM